MGVGMIFLGAEIGDFSKNLLGGPKWMKVVFFPLETKKTTFYLKFSKSRGATASLTPLTTPMALPYTFRLSHR